MSPRRVDFRILDILHAIEAIFEYTTGMTFQEFRKDRKTVDSVVRNLIVIGEAASHIPSDLAGMADPIPWAEMKGMRNVVVHEYFGVSDRILWETVQNNLPEIVEPLRDLLKAIQNSEGFGPTEP